MKRRKRKNKSKNIYQKSYFGGNRLKKRKRKKQGTSLPTSDNRSYSPPRKKLKVNHVSDSRNDSRKRHVSNEKSVILLKLDSSEKNVFYYLEQLILKHNLQQELSFQIIECKRSLRIEIINAGHAQRFVQFLRHVLPCRLQKSNISSVKSLSLLPFQPFDLVLLSPELFQKSGNSCGPFVVCEDYGRVVKFVDPISLKTCEVDGKTGVGISKVFSISEAEEYTILNAKFTGLRTEGNKYVQGEIEVEKTSELGSGVSKIVFCHFSHFFEVGDIVYGYDLEKMNFGETVNQFRKRKKARGNSGMEVVLVRKKFRHGVTKHWKLKKLDNIKMDRSNDDFNIFSNLVAENLNWRKNIKLYKNENFDFSDWGKEKKQKGMDVVELTELMDDLAIED